MDKKTKERDVRYEPRAKHLDAVICVAALIMVVVVTTIALLWIHMNVLNKNGKNQANEKETGSVLNESNYLETEEIHDEHFVLEQEVAFNNSITGVNLRASGVNYDLRKDNK